MCGLATAWARYAWDRAGCTLSETVGEVGRRALGKAVCEAGGVRSEAAR